MIIRIKYTHNLCTTNVCYLHIRIIICLARSCMKIVWSGKSLLIATGDKINEMEMTVNDLVNVNVNIMSEALFLLCTNGAWIILYCVIQICEDIACIIYHKLSFSIFVHNSQITIIILHVFLQNEFLILSSPILYFLSRKKKPLAQLVTMYIHNRKSHRTSFLFYLWMIEFRVDFSFANSTVNTNCNKLERY